MPVPERALVALHAGAGDGVLSGGEFEAPCPYAAHHTPGRISLVPGGLYRLPLNAFPPPAPPLPLTPTRMFSVGRVWFS